jgi:hypothetical protein
MYFMTLDLQVGSRHHEQNREGSKVQIRQYAVGWAGLLHLVSKPKTTRLKVGRLWYPTSEVSVQSQSLISNAGR